LAKKILVVEDGGDLRATFVAVLTRVGGYETIEAINGREAIEKSVSEKPDLILMDVALPEISGIDAARAVKNNLRTAHIPIIAQTASMESGGFGGRNSGLPSKANVGEVDHIHH
jgi:CheY-like chemotaxis protein